MKFKCTVNAYDLDDIFYINSENIYSAWGIFLERLNTRMHHDYDLLTNTNSSINLNVKISKKNPDKYF